MYVVPGAEHLAQLLVDASADVHAVDEQGETPLQIATRCGAEIVSRCAHYHSACLCCDRMGLQGDGRRVGCCVGQARV